MPYPMSPSEDFNPTLNGDLSFPQLETEILFFWQQDHTFNASLQQRDGNPEWVFYDGPPFANGLPHYGHLLTGYAKDVFPRFHTMRGKKVDRRFGWDTHGLPAELEAERQLGITEKAEIEAMGIAAFNAAAKDAVLHYTERWQEYVTRQGRWVDFENDYKTLDVTYMESVIWAFSELYKKGLAYEGYRVLPYCWRDQTPLSNHELRMDEHVYAMRQDQTVTVSFPLKGVKAAELDIEHVRILAWTTTPWTLPTNLALVVGPEIEYCVIPSGPNGAQDTPDVPAKYLLAKDLVTSHAQELGYTDAEEAYARVEKVFSGAQLGSVEYEPMWQYYTDVEKYSTHNAWRILVDPYVTVEDGTGVVHQAPAYGEDDQRICEAAGIPVILSVDNAGKFLPEITEAAGMHAFEANRVFIKLLRQQGRLLKQASYDHPYPHCWRCRNPLIYKAVSSWFIKVTAIKKRLIELNEAIDWFPSNVKDGQFGKWLEGARDWSISRNRYFGSPLPIWKSDNPEYPRVDVYGSLEEIQRDFGTLPLNAEGKPDLHRPFIDELVRPNPDDPSGQSMMRRIPDVLDVWFDSGSMPFAQVHYPFEHQQWFDSHNPSDFIVEYIGQTRGWFYVLHVLSTALFDRPAFKRVLSHGIVLGRDGQKMSKSLRNYPDVSEVFDRDGSDAMRWFLLSNPLLRGGNLSVTEQGIREASRQFLLPLWNTWYFFSLYANACCYEATTIQNPTHELDRYVLAKTEELLENITKDYEAFDTTAATTHLRDFTDMLTNWYIRRSRDRFWGGVQENGEGSDAFDTLYTVLETLLRVSCPLAPFTTEYIWKSLTGKRSIHLESWPEPKPEYVQSDLVQKMDRIRAISSSAQHLRKNAQLRVRLPLPKLTVVAQNVSELEPFSSILQHEINVKKVTFVEETEQSIAKYNLTTRLVVHARAAGPRLGKTVQQVIVGARSGRWQKLEAGVVVDGMELLEGEYDIVLDTQQSREDVSQEIAVLDEGGFMLLETKLTPELEAEGFVRDLIRAIQDTRKEAQLNVSDRIFLTVVFDSKNDYNTCLLGLNHVNVAAETLCLKMHFYCAEDVQDHSSSEEYDHTKTFETGVFSTQGKFDISLSRTSQAAL